MSYLPGSAVEHARWTLDQLWVRGDVRERHSHDAKGEEVRSLRWRSGDQIRVHWGAGTTGTNLRPLSLVAARVVGMTSRTVLASAVQILAPRSLRR